jgi:hypothetical protein
MGVNRVESPHIAFGRNRQIRLGPLAVGSSAILPSFEDYRPKQKNR